jgi:hypothetical protein
VVDRSATGPRRHRVQEHETRDDVGKDARELVIDGTGVAIHGDEDLNAEDGGDGEEQSPLPGCGARDPPRGRNQTR